MPTALHLRQALVTALAAVASYYVASFLNLPESYWAVISSIIVMQSSVGGTVDAAWNRLAGTAIGALVGAMFATFWGTDLLAFGVANTMTFWICASLRLPESYRLACVTVSVVMLVSRHEIYWVIALRRFLEVGIGIVVSLIVTVAAWPARARKHLQYGIASALHGIDDYYQLILRRYRGELRVPIRAIREDLREQLRLNDILLKEAIYELAMGTSPATLALWKDHLERLFLAVEAVELSTREGRGALDEQPFEPELSRLLTGISSAFGELEEAVAAGRFNAKGPSLEEAISALDRKVAEIRQSGLILRFSFEGAMRFYAFLSTVRNLAQEVERASPEELEGEALS